MNDAQLAVSIRAFRDATPAIGAKPEAVFPGLGAMPGATSPWIGAMPFALLLTLALAMTSAAPVPAAAQDTAGLAPFTWMAGCWAATLSSGALYEEWWMSEAGGVMLGMSRMSRGDAALSFEYMRITLDGETPVYTAQPSGRDPTAFRYRGREDGAVVFENPENDFPQRIRYADPASGQPFARIEGERAGETRGFDFPLVRVECPGAGAPGRG